MILGLLICACLPLIAVAAFADGVARNLSALVLVGVLIIATLLVGLVAYAGDLGTWPYTVAALAVETSVGIAVARRLHKTVRGAL